MITEALRIPAGVVSCALALVLLFLLVRRIRAGALPRPSDRELVGAIVVLFAFLGVGLLLHDTRWIGVAFAITFPVLLFKRLRDGSLE